MIIASGAQTRLNSAVFAIDKSLRDGRTVWEVLSNEGRETFDGIVLASPYVSFYTRQSDDSICRISQ